MRREKHSFTDRIATAARTFLLLFLAFLLGYGWAQMDSVRRVQNSIVSGDAHADMLAYAKDPIDKQLTVWSTAADALHGGALLIGPEFSKKLAALLVDGKGRILHRWDMENGFFNPAIKQWWKDLPANEESAVDDALLLPGGDLVFIQLLTNENNYRGQRLARIDKDSRVVWQVPGNFHHYLAIAGTPPCIYALTSRPRKEIAEVAPPNPLIQYLEDYIEVYSLDGKKLHEWSLTDAFEHSPYRDWLATFDISIDVVQRITQPDGRIMYDLLHVNSVQYLDAAKARALPFAKEGDLLVSFRTLSAVVVFRPSTEQIVWATKGPFRHQHSAQVEDDGKLYLYDNEGRQAVTVYRRPGPPEQYLSRLIRFNPFTNQAEEIYGSFSLYSYFLGSYQPFADGSWIISSPQQGRVVVVSPAKEIVWELRTVPDRYLENTPHRKQISFMHYYPAAALSFLNAGGGVKAQP